MRELRRRQQAHALQREISQVGLSVLQELAQLIASANEQARFAIHVDNQVDRFEENGIACVRVLNFLRLQRFLRLVEDRVQAFVQATADRWII